MTTDEIKSALLMECAKLDERLELLDEQGSDLADRVNLRGRQIAYLRVVRLIEYGISLSSPAEA